MRTSDQVYKVNGITFHSFEDVVRYAWDELKMELDPRIEDEEINEEEAIKELNRIFEEEENE
jgi:hypothetical protein